MLEVFDYQGQQVRTDYKDEAVWFVAADVCRVLDIINPTMAVGRLDDDEKGLSSIETLGGNQQMVVVNEAGLYSLIKALTELKKEREEKKRLELENAVKAQQIAEMQPKVSYYDIVLACPDLVTITQIAKDFGMSAKKLNKILKEKKIQFKQGRTWFLYQKYAEQGYTQSKTYLYDEDNHTAMHTLWTQKGRLFIYELLKADGILPVMERE